MPSQPTVLVVGATGKQGGAVINALLADKSPAAQSFKILALSRDAEAPRAKALAAKSDRIKVVQGDALQPAAIFSSIPKGSVTDLFLVTIPPKEEAQAIPLIDEAVAHGVTNIVFNSVDRGGDTVSWSTPTDIPHFYEKHNIEAHLRDAAAKAEPPVTWTVLRPVYFMDNLKPSSQFAVGVSMWSISLAPDQNLQMVATSDIGRWAAAAIIARVAATEAVGTAGTAKAESPFTNKAFSLAGDEMSITEMRAKFRRIVGHDAAQSWWPVGKLVLLFVADMGLMFRWFARGGYGADIGKLRTDGPGPAPMTFEEWLRTESGWVKK